MALLSVIATAGRDFQQGGYKVNYGVYSPTNTSLSGVVNSNLGNSFRDVRTGSRAIAIHNLKDGQSLTVLVSGASGNVITFSAYSDNGVTSLPIQYGSGYTNTMVSPYSLFTVYRIGGSLNLVTLFSCHLT